MIRVQAGEEYTLEIGDYTFHFSGPVELRSKDLERLRRAVRAATAAEERIRGERRTEIGFK